MPQPKRGWLSNTLSALTRWPWLTSLVALLIIAGGVWWFLSNLNVVATVDGHKITKAEYQEMAPRLQKFYEYNDDQESLKDLQTSVINYLVEDKIIEVEANKRGVKADPAKVEKRYKAIVSQYKNEETYAQTIDALYGWTPELNKQAIERDLLREQLEPFELAYRAGKAIMIQHRTGGGLVGMSIEAYQNRAKRVIEDLQQLAEAKGFDAAYTEASKYVKTRTVDDPLIVVAMDFSWRANQTGVEKQQLDAVYATAQGQRTGIVETDTLYGLFDIRQVGEGSHPSWEDFIAKYPKKIYKSRLTQSWYKSIWEDVSVRISPDRVFAVTNDRDNDGVKNNVDNCPDNANAGQKNTDGDSKGDACDNDDDNDGINDSADNCPIAKENLNGYQDSDGCPDVKPADPVPNCSAGGPQCHASTLSGNVKDSVTGQNLNNVSVRIYTNDSTNSCQTNPNQASCKCGPKAQNTSTGSGGNYGPVGGITGSGCFINCYYGNWHVEFSKTGYETKDLFFNPPNGSSIDITTQLRPRTAVVNVQAKRTDNDNVINNVSITGNGNLTIDGGSTSFTREHSLESINHTYTAPNKTEGNGGGELTFADRGWDGCTSWPDGPQQKRCHIEVPLDSVKTITAWYKPVEEPGPTAVTCSGPTSAAINQDITFSSQTAGNWFAYTGNPGAATGTISITTRFSTTGDKTVRIYKSGSSTEWADCVVNIGGPGDSQPVSCTAVPSTAYVNTTAHFVAAGGNGTYGWSGGGAPASKPASPENTFDTVYNSAGLKTVTVTSGSTNNCLINIISSTSPPPPPPAPAGSTPDSELDFDQGERPPVY